MGELIDKFVFRFCQFGIAFVILMELIFLFFGLFVLPMILNRKFDPIFGPKPGESWEPGKGGLNPYHVFFRCYDYAKAILFERFSRRKLT